jgi:hypothetical protein
MVPIIPWLHVAVRIFRWGCGRLRHSPADLIADDKIRFGLSASMAAFIAIFIPIITGLRLGARAFPGQPAFPCS